MNRFPLPARASHKPSLRRSTLLLPDCPGEGFFSGEDWNRLGAKLKLTNTELCVTVLIFEGKTRAQIARRLGCAFGTVGNHFDHLFRKLNVRNRVELVLRITRIHRSLSAGSS